MNRFKGHISAILTEGSMSLVTADMGCDIHLSAVVIETTETSEYMQVGTEIAILFKESEVVLSKGNPEHLSITNTLPVRVAEIERNPLFSLVTLESEIGAFKALLCTPAVDHLKLKTNERIYAHVKTNEVMLSEI